MLRSPIIQFVACLLAFTAAANSARADDSEFRTAIDRAQARTVKIYGAGIGREAGYASGLMVSAEGRILTSLGIYLGGERIRVVLPDGALHFAQVERRSEAWQLALLKIDAATPTFFEVPEKTTVRAGDWVVAVSNAFRVADGSEPLSATLGVVSLRTPLELKRGVQDLSFSGDVLVIDCITSNPGAPGGAVMTAEGELAGMVGRLVEDKATGTRLNYAVPADVLRKFLAGDTGPKPALATEPVAGKAELGLHLFTLGGKKGPAYIERVTANSAASAAGLKPDDLILSLAGKPVKDVREYEAAIASLRPGEKVELVIKRKQETLSVTITPATKE